MDINLNRVFSLTRPVKCWVKDNEKDEYVERWLVERREKFFVCIHKKRHDEEIDMKEMRNHLTTWNYCVLDDPTGKGPKQWKTLKDIPVQLWGNAWVKTKNQRDIFIKILIPSAIIEENLDNKMEGNKYVWLPITENPIENENWRPFDDSSIQ